MEPELVIIRTVRWVGDSRERLQEFPAQVRKDIGHALYLVQTGQTPPSAKPMRGIGSSVFEIVDDYDTDTYRAVYTVKVGSRLYILHAFMKKSKRGISTPKREIDLIRRRLRRAREMEAEEDVRDE
ncbi:MAG: type II toxin-antitoxin system RelE/ParE family toxin [Candidatus Tectomicrobia bacterium]|nr:type II toxin-antitoxin system RelE/ParE family toxin [Candidatus Tectomicrobia bacterium]